MLILTACTNNNTDEKGKTEGVANGGVAKYSVKTEPMVFWDPSDSFSAEIIAMQNMYETLIRYDVENDTYVNIIAESYSKSDDGLTWNFKIREGIKFHTGTTLDANSVKKSIDRTMERGKGASYIWEPVESINVVNDYEVEFKLKYAADLEGIVSAGYSAYIFDVDAIEKNGEEWLLEGNDAGSGPYTVEKWTNGSQLVLKAFPDYWKGWKENQFQKVVFEVNPESNTNQQLIQAGKIDISNSLTAEGVESLKETPGVRIETSPAFQNLTMQLNTQKAPFNDPKVRQAVAYAIPYNTIIDDVLGGLGEQSNGYVPTGLWGHSEDLQGYEENIDKAKLLIQEANVEQKDVTLTYVSGDEVERRTAELLKATLNNIGLNVEIKEMTWEAQWDLSKSADPNERQDMFLIYYWSGYSDPYGYLSMPYGTETDITYNLGYYSNEEFDSKINEAKQIAGIDKPKSEQLYKEAQEILLNDVPGISLIDMKYSYAVKDDFKGFVSNPYYANVVFFYDTYRE